MYVSIVKPFFDRATAFVVLIVASPLLVLSIILLWFANKGNIWFLQERPGKDGKIFRVFKFKTMTDERDAEGNLLPDDKRLTAIGKFVRKTSLDELPQMINVLKGDMSIVGPRPLLVEYLPLYTEVPLLTPSALNTFTTVKNKILISNAKDMLSTYQTS